MIEEIWKVCTRNDNYMVSNLGNVLSIKNSSLLKPWKHKSGHLYLKLGRGISHQVHHLVLEAFVGNRRKKEECRHLDGNPENNKVENLQWGSRKENVDDFRKHSGKYAKSKLTNEIALKIINLSTGKRGERRNLAVEFGVSIHVINDMLLGRTYDYLRR